MEFILLMAVILFLFLRARRKNIQSSQISPELAERQGRYLKQMNTRPKLRGDGQFANRVVGEHAYQEDLEIVRQMLIQDYTLNSTFMAMIEVEPDNPVDPNAVRVLVGDETVGYLPAPQAALLQPVLLQLGGAVLAEARLADSVESELIQIEVDFVYPLEIIK
jgi:hypothetical protein